MNHPTHVAMHVECPACGSVHVYRTGRRWEEARSRGAAAPAAAHTGTATGATAAPVRAAQELTHA